ncbi:MAG: cytochrome-c oxidase, cbb3-type subunit III [Gammaproteobacteria bacterium]
MADLPSGFWAGWIAVLTIVSLIGLIWLSLSIYMSREEYKSPVWDENLREGSTPAPLWWFWLMFALLIFSDIYLVLYPGLGSYRGALDWSQGRRLVHSKVAYNDDFEGVRKLVEVAPLETLHDDPDVMASAGRGFARNCAACHGSDGKGQASYFPNLIDDNWQWGGSANQIEQSIRMGRQGAMPAWADALGEDGVTQVTQYVIAMGDDEAAQEHDKGQELYEQFCVACHGIEGTGNVMLGAPSLVDDTWLYGSAEADVEHSIAIGRNGVMPAFQDRLDETQIRMLVAWLTRDSD